MGHFRHMHSQVDTTISTDGKPGSNSHAGGWGEAIFRREVVALEGVQFSGLELSVGLRVLAVLESGVDGDDPDVIQVGDLCQELLVAREPEVNRLRLSVNNLNY